MAGRGRTTHPAHPRRLRNPDRTHRPMPVMRRAGGCPPHPEPTRPRTPLPLHWRRPMTVDQLSDRDRELLELPLPELLAAARERRDRAHGSRVTYSPKVFIPLTMLCRDRCGYCTFAQPPARLAAPYLLPEEVLDIARRGASVGCHEALFTLVSGRRSAIRLRRSGSTGTATTRRSTTWPTSPGSYSKRPASSPTPMPAPSSRTNWHNSARSPPHRE